MNEKKVKKQLRKMLGTFTAGTILHLLSEILNEEAEEARRAGDERGRKLLNESAAALLVFGAGLNLACPHDWEE